MDYDILRRWHEMTSQPQTTTIIQELRQHGMTYQQIADNIGVAWLTAHRWGTGESKPRPAGPINTALYDMLAKVS